MRTTMVLLPFLAIFLLIAGCVNLADINAPPASPASSAPVQPEPPAASPVTREQSQQIAEQFIQGNAKFKAIDHAAFRLLEARSLSCEYCWQFVFDVYSDTGSSNGFQIAVPVQNGQVNEKEVAINSTQEGALTAESCTARGGRVVEATAGLACPENEITLGTLTLARDNPQMEGIQIVPATCCKSKENAS